MGCGIYFPLDYNDQMKAQEEDDDDEEEDPVNNDSGDSNPEEEEDEDEDGDEYFEERPRQAEGPAQKGVVVEVRLYSPLVVVGFVVGGGDGGGVCVTDLRCRKVVFLCR